MSEVRGRSREDPMPEGRRSRGATPRLRPGAAVLAQEGQGELLHVQGQEGRL